MSKTGKKPYIKLSIYNVESKTTEKGMITLWSGRDKNNRKHR